MINKETILSVFDDKMTLLQFLKEVEKGLKDGVVKSFERVVVDETHFKLKLVFEDDSELVTQSIAISNTQIPYEAGRNINLANYIISVVDNPTFTNIVVDNGTSALYVSSTGDVGLLYKSGDTETNIRIIEGVPEILSKSEDYEANLRVGTQEIRIESKDLNEETTKSLNLINKIDVLDKTSYDENKDVLVTSKPLIEPLEGCAMTINAFTGLLINGIYGGMERNGNKFTIAIVLELTKTASSISGDTDNVVTLSIPSNIGAKLLPVQLGGYYWLANNEVNAYLYSEDYVKVPCKIYKSSNTSLRLGMNLNNLVINNKYCFRYEVTFLLGDSLFA